MARDFSRAFYRSRAWRSARDAYAASVHGLCERCLARGALVPGEIVHHRVHLTPENVGDPSVSLAFGNLELLCRACHADEHPEVYGRDAPREGPRVAFDENGDLVPPGDGGFLAGGMRRGRALQ